MRQPTKILVATTALLLPSSFVLGFAPVILSRTVATPIGAVTNNNDDDASATAATVEAQVVCEATRLKDELLDLAEKTHRGFRASKDERKRAQQIVKELSDMNPTKEPASSYYEAGSTSSSLDSDTADLAGKWTLVYTDAPDITSLESGPLSTAQLGRIGQECSPPFIKNVIEWTKPEFARSLSLPFSGLDDDRILQKVVCEASATPSNPTAVDLKLVGLDIVGGRGDKGDDNADEGESNNIISRIQAGPAGLVGRTPFELRGFVKAPFGKFKVLYLDEAMRIIETYQGYLAINCRQMPGEEWF